MSISVNGWREDSEHCLVIGEWLLFRKSRITVVNPENMTRWFWTSTILAISLIVNLLWQRQEVNQLKHELAHTQAVLNQASELLLSCSRESIERIEGYFPYPIQINRPLHNLIYLNYFCQQELEEGFTQIEQESRVRKINDSGLLFGFVIEELELLKNKTITILRENRLSLGLEGDYFDHYLNEYLEIFETFSLFTLERPAAISFLNNLGEVRNQSRVLVNSLLQKILELRGHLLRCFPTYYVLAEPIGEHGHPDSVEVRLALVDLYSVTQYEGVQLCYEDEELSLGESGLHQLSISKDDLADFSGQYISVEGVNALTGESWSYYPVQREPLMLWPSAVF